MVVGWLWTNAFLNEKTPTNWKLLLGFSLVSESPLLPLLPVGSWMLVLKAVPGFLARTRGICISADLAHLLFPHAA